MFVVEQPSDLPVMLYIFILLSEGKQSTLPHDYPTVVKLLPVLLVFTLTTCIYKTGISISIWHSHDAPPDANHTPIRHLKRHREDPHTNSSLIMIVIQMLELFILEPDHIINA